jgi:hypothetical protein
MKSIIFLCLFIGLTFMIIGYVKTNATCPPPQIQYRYIPRTILDEQMNPEPVMSVFANMFEKPSPWDIANGLDWTYDMAYKNFQNTLNNEMSGVPALNSSSPSVPSM